ncbi:hypothetical protein BJ944DRAFT_259394 [Cunninghamella echinulata]|nr:hypothetical protein BJ944DRAFT_259394 [Cunninghamella echinulata]
MKFSVISFVAATIATVSAQLTSPTGVFNVSSPQPNYPYVIGQALPCTYQLFPQVDTSGITLTINLVAATGGANATNLVISTAADVSKTSASAKQNGNVTYYEHSINFPIPTTISAGSYNVVFSANGAPLNIPITVLPFASTPTIPNSGKGSAPTGGTSIFTGGSASRMSGLDLTKKTAFALSAVAVIAFVF